MHRIIGSPPLAYAALRARRAPFREFSSDPQIRSALWDVQRGRCAYCERRLRDPARPDHGTRIEHFHPQSLVEWGSDCALCTRAADGDDAPTVWTNLLLCCDGSERAGSVFTCDKKKADQHICTRFRNPKTWTAERLVEVERSGEVSAVGGMPAGAADVIDTVLNLNAEHLVAARRRVAAALRKTFNAEKNRRHGLTSAQRAKMATAWRERAETAEYATVFLSLADWVERPK